MPATAPHVADLAAAARFYEYSSAADPRIAPVPYRVFTADTWRGAGTRALPWDLSADLGCAWPATSPALLASFLRVRAGEELATAAAATSQLFYVIEGEGATRGDDVELTWSAGDLFTLPSCGALTHRASADAALYHVSDEPLLRYLGAQPAAPRFRATVYRRATLEAQLEAVRAQPGSADRNRLGVILGNADTAQTRTATHVLWSLLNILPARATQKPHRHNSAALDLCVSAAPGAYTLIAKEIDAQGRLVEPIRADWAPGAAFVTPPGWWHSHHNDSDVDARVLPIQDAGLHTWMRTLDIRFVR